MDKDGQRMIKNRLRSSSEPSTIKSTTIVVIQMRGGGLGYGPLSMPECEEHFQAALELTMQTYIISATDLLDEVMQL